MVGRRGSLTPHFGKDGEILATFTGNGGLGEEIAAVGDLDGDGLSEILAGAPDGGYALVVSFGDQGETKATPPLTIAIDRGFLRLEWSAAYATWTLESSSDLQTWLPVSPQPNNRTLTVPVEGAGQAMHYRLRNANQSMD